MTPFEWIMAIAAVAGVVGGGISLYQSSKSADKSAELAQSNLDLNKDVSEKNFNLQQEQFEYQKQLNETVMNREDTAFQRQVADLKAAGLSPLMVAGGAQATPLTSANAPQKDVSGINTALGNLMGAYNDIFNRKMNRHQFLLNTAATSAQLYTNIAESKLNQKKIKLENDILDLDYKYYKNHPERNLGLTNVLVNLASRLIGGSNGSALDVTLPKVSLPSVSSNESAGKLFDLVSNDSKKSGKEKINDIVSLLSNSGNNNPVDLSNLKVDDNRFNDDNYYFATPGKSMSKQLKSAYNIISTRSNPNDKKLNDSLDFIWKNTSAALYFDNFDSFKKKVLSDSSYQKNISKHFKFVIYPAHYFD